jgi:hypothetical protein
MSGKFTPREKGRFRTITKAELDKLSKEQGLTVPGALAMIMEREKQDGLRLKGGPLKAIDEANEENPNPEDTGDAGSSNIDGDAADAGEGKEDADDGPSQQYDDELVIAAKVALRLDERANAPDRVYILSNYPSKVKCC